MIAAVAGRVGLIAILAIAPPRATAQTAAPEPAMQLRVGHSYSSVSALRQPATFVVSADLGRPTMTKIDAGLLAQLAWGHGGVDAGVRASAGSVRTRPERSYGGILRAWRTFDPVALAWDGEYEADGGFDVQKGILAAELTPLGGLPGLGVWVRPDIRFRWRPWVGLGFGNVFSTDDPDTGAEAGAFTRGMARIEMSYAPGGPSPAGEERDSAQLDIEATGWLLFDASRGEGYVKAALSIPVAQGLSIAASAEAGREPPRFELSRRIGVGLGYSH